MKTDFIIFDWAGTLIDFGCRAPLVAFLEAFEAAGLPISEEVARRPMGTHKRDHAREILAYPEVTERVRTELGREPDEALVTELYDDFTERLHRLLPEYAGPIPGVVETLRWLRSRGIRLGGTTGYTRAMMDVIEPLARAGGIVLDAVICADEVSHARPAPWACFHLAERFGIYPMSRGLKIGDTAADMAEGRNAGMTALGVTATGNEVGLEHAAFAALPAAERVLRLDEAASRLRAGGAHDVVASVADLPAWLEARAGRNDGWGGGSSRAGMAI
jgi:phosphonoacetaldehyde hydrolase